MANPEVHVYARCSAGRRRYLQVLFSGTRSQCKKFVRDRVAARQPTHFIDVSSLKLRTATRKFCDGATWDEASCSYLD